MKNNIIGRWRIIEMEQWDQEYIDEAVPGYIEFDKKKTGTFQFGYVEGSTDWRIEKVGGHERVAFSGKVMMKGIRSVEEDGQNIFMIQK